MPESKHTAWETYRDAELLRIQPLLEKYGFELHQTQPHLLGERPLMVGGRDVGGGGLKLILVGTRTKDKLKVIIKASSDAPGIEEIERERRARSLIVELPFSYEIFTAPSEIFHTKENGCCISIAEYIEHDLPFLERPIEDQFDLALRALKIQEHAHASTYGHESMIRNSFGITDAKEYGKNLSSYIAVLTEVHPDTKRSLQKVLQEFMEKQSLIEQYTGFLTHADFVPHNLRIRNGVIYLLDYASIHFGNKYESWARFINFMMLYNPKLAEALVKYVADNRTPEESESLRLMRLYKLVYLLLFHQRNLNGTIGKLHSLTEIRIAFWSKALDAVLARNELSPEILQSYKTSRDSLRSEEEKKRQENLH